MESPVNRPTCGRCAIKHIGQAAILMNETRMGYPLHIYYALAHMAEASDELIDMMPDEAAAVREERLKVEDGLRTGTAYVPEWDRLMVLIAEGAMLEETMREEETR